MALSPNINPFPPPMNNMAVKVDKNKIEAYSAKKNKTNIEEEYSVICPDTNSDSASTVSKGGLAHSAIQPIKNIINKGNKGSPNHTVSCISIK